MAVSPEHDIVVMRFPLYAEEDRVGHVDGNLAHVKLFVEQVRFFQISSQKFLNLGTLNPQIRFGLRMSDHEYEYGTPRETDPVRLYRALKILGRFEPLVTTPVHTPYMDLSDIYAAAGHNYPLRSHHYVRNRITGMIGGKALDEILQMIPPNLMAVVENLHKQKAPVNGQTLQTEISRGHIESNQLYERVIQETNRRRRVEKQVTSRIWRHGLLSIA